MRIRIDLDTDRLNWGRVGRWCLLITSVILLTHLTSLWRPLYCALVVVASLSFCLCVLLLGTFAILRWAGVLKEPEDDGIPYATELDESIP